MNPIREILKVDVVQEQGHQYLKSKQYDNLSREYQLVFTNRGIPIILEGTEIIEVNLWKQGELSPYSRRLCSWEGTIPIWTLTLGSLKYEGTIDVEFVITSLNGSKISSRNMHIIVQKSLIGYAGLIKSEEFDVLNHLIIEASAIPSLIETFNLSQEEINQLIQKVNNDISSYSSNYQNLSTQVQDLINNVNVFLNTVKSTENERIVNENNRISSEQQRKNAEKVRQEKDALYQSNDEARELAERQRQTNTAEAIKRADSATDQSKSTTLLAEEEIDKIKAIIAQYEYTITDLDGGYPTTSESDYVDDYNGGTP